MYLPDVLTTDVATGSLALCVQVLPPSVPSPVSYLTVRLTNGVSYYSAGSGSAVSGGLGSVDQGAPGAISTPWPVILSNGTASFGTFGHPIYVDAENGITANAGTGSFSVTGSVVVSGVSSVTGSVSLSSAPTVVQGTSPWVVSGSSWIPTVTGSVSLSAPVAVSNFPAVQTVTGSVVLATDSQISSGSVVGLLVGGQPLAGANPVPVTGSVGISAPISVGNWPAVQVVSGSSWIPTVTGSVSLSSAVAVSNFPAVQTITGSVIVAAAPTRPIQSIGTVTGSVGASLAAGFSTAGVEQLSLIFDNSSGLSAHAATVKSQYLLPGGAPAYATVVAGASVPIGASYVYSFGPGSQNGPVPAAVSASLTGVGIDVPVIAAIGR